MLKPIAIILGFAGAMIVGVTLPRVLSDWAMAQIMRGMFIAIGIGALVLAYFVPSLAYNLPR